MDQIKENIINLSNQIKGNIINVNNKKQIIQTGLSVVTVYTLYKGLQNFNEEKKVEKLSKNGKVEKLSKNGKVSKMSNKNKNKKYSGEIKLINTELNKYNTHDLIKKNDINIDNINIDHLKKNGQISFSWIQKDTSVEESNIYFQNYFQDFNSLQIEGDIKPAKAITFFIKKNITVEQLKKTYKKFNQELNDRISFENFCKISNSLDNY